MTSRMTRHKKLILDILRSTNTHPTADWIFNQARKEIPNISLSTIYRNLSILKNEGEIQELNYIGSFGYFDGNPQNHYHFLCKKCRNVYDVNLPIQSYLDEKVSKLCNIRVIEHNILFYGLCQDCNNSNQEHNNFKKKICYSKVRNNTGGKN